MRNRIKKYSFNCLVALCNLIFCKGQGAIGNGKLLGMIDLNVSKSTYSLSYLNKKEYLKSNGYTIGFNHKSLLNKQSYISIGTQYCNTRYQRTNNYSNKSTISNTYLDFPFSYGFIFYPNSKVIILNCGAGLAFGWLIDPSYRTNPKYFSKAVMGSLVEASANIKIIKKIYINIGVSARYYLSEIELGDRNNTPPIFNFKVGLSYIWR